MFRKNENKEALQFISSQTWIFSACRSSFVLVRCWNVVFSKCASNAMSINWYWYAFRYQDFHRLSMNSCSRNLWPASTATWERITCLCSKLTFRKSGRNWRNAVNCTKNVDSSHIRCTTISAKSQTRGRHTQSLRKSRSTSHDYIVFLLSSGIHRGNSLFLQKLYLSIIQTNSISLLSLLSFCSVVARLELGCARLFWGNSDGPS